MKAQWPLYTDFMGRLATSFVGQYAVLTAASVVLPGKYAQAISDVPMDKEMAAQVDAVKKKFMDSPNDGYALANFFTSLVLTRANIKKKTADAKSGKIASSSATASMMFTPTPTKSDGKLLRCLNDLVAKFVNYNVTLASASSEEIIDLAKEVESAAFAVHSTDSTWPGLDIDIKEITRNLRQSLRQHKAEQIVPTDMVTPERGITSSRRKSRRVALEPEAAVEQPEDDTVKKRSKKR